MAVQGPKSFQLMEKVFGEQITKLKFFGFDYFEFGGDKHLIASLDGLNKVAMKFIWNTTSQV